MKTEVLEKIFEKYTEPSGSFCFICGSEKLSIIHDTRGEYFMCENNHKNDRHFLFDKNTVNYVENGELVHQTVGAIIKQNTDESPLFLLFLRRKFPFQYTIPAGHVEIGLSLEHNVIKEIQEETNLSVTKIKQLWAEETFRLHDPCRRGADYHYWNIYEAQAQGQLQLSDEGRIIGWFSEQEIKQFSQKKLLTQPVNYFFSRYFNW